jgi:hypothetical protein
MATSMAAGAAVGVTAPAATTDATAIDGPTGSGVGQTATNDSAVGTAAPEPGTTATWIWEAEDSNTFNYDGGTTVSDAAASGGNARQFDGDDPTGTNSIFGGPNEPVTPGWYVVSYRMKVDDTSVPGQVATVDFASINTNNFTNLRSTSTRPIPAGAFDEANTYETFSFPVYFPLDDDVFIQDRNKQFRIQYQGGATLTVDRIEVRSVDADYAAVPGNFSTFSSASAAAFGQRAGDQYLINATGIDTGQDPYIDEYSTIYRQDALATDGNVTVTVPYQEATHSNGFEKAGLVVRNDLTGANASAGYAQVGATAKNGFYLNGDTDGNGQLNANAFDSAGSTNMLDAPTASDQIPPGYPVTLRLEREGDTVTGYYSLDQGATFTQISTQTIPGTNDALDVGMFGLSHDDNENGTVVFDGFTVNNAVAPGPRPTLNVTVDRSSIPEDETATANLTLSSAPAGLAGYTLTIGADDPSVVRTTGASFPDAFNLTKATFGPDNETVTLQATDVENRTVPGDTDVRLASVELTGDGGGSTSVTVQSIDLLDAEDGSSIDADVAGASVSSTGTSFVVSGLTAPGNVSQGDPVTVDATVTNVGTTAGSETVSFRLAGDTLATQQVSLGAGDTAQVSFTLQTTGLDIGTYTHGVFSDGGNATADLTVRGAAFDVVNLLAPSRVTEGETVTVESTIANVGNANGSTTATFSFDGQQVNSTPVSLQGGDTTVVSFQLSTAGVIPGTYEHQVTAGNATRTATITVESAGPPPLTANGSAPLDGDGDGRYEDVDGDGNVGFDDVVVLFEQFDSDAVQSSGSAFDFNANGRVDFDDLVRLFTSI